jgi:hypothetical protein
MNEETLLIIRIKLEALITEREGMVALNQYRIGLGQSIAYDDAQFFRVMDDMRRLLDGANPEGEKGEEDA